MSKKTDNIMSALQSLGLNLEETTIFLYINKNGSCTALSISKECNISRTKVYRILDNLIKKKLIVQLMGDRGLKFEVVADLNLDLFLVQKESELESLRESLPFIQQELSSSSINGRHKSKVVYFHGIQGLEQVTWNSTKAKGPLRIYEMSETMTEFLNISFSEKVRQEFVNNKVLIKQLTNHKKIAGYTKITELVTKYWECRYINPKELSMKFEILVYDNVVVVYTYKQDEIFCVEIHNPYLAEMQTQIFDFVWNSAKPLKILDASGTAELV